MSTYKDWLKRIVDLLLVNKSTKSNFNRYSIAVLTTLIVLVLKVWLIRAINWPEGSLVLSTGAILVSAWFGGFGPGMLATFLNYLIADLFFIGPHYLILLNTPSENIRILIFVTEGVLTSLICELLHRSVQRAEEYAEKTTQGEQLLHSLINNVDDYGIFMVNRRGRITTWSNGATSVTGYGASEVIGKSFSSLLAANEQDRSNKSLKLDQFNIIKRKSEKWRYKKDGTLYYGNITVFPILDSKNKIFGYSVTIQDITDKKLLEDRKTEFLSIAAHELKTPVTIVKTITDVLLSKLKKSDPDYWKDLIDIDNELEKLIVLINDLLDISRLDTNKLSLNITNFNLTYIINHLVHKFKTISGNRNIVFKANGSIYVKGDKERLEQVLINFLINADRFSTKESQIAIELKKDLKNITVSVKDQGEGISKDGQNAIFDKFYQISQNSKNSKGFGLGLFISKEIIKHHGGKIWVSSEEGKGSTFSFSLPM